MDPDHDADHDSPASSDDSGPNADGTDSDSNTDGTDSDRPVDDAENADEPRTLTVRVGSAERIRSEALERVRAAERGDEVDERHVLGVEDEADLARLVSETNLELLRAIAEHEPRSMRQVEEIVGRDHKEVHRNLTELEALGVVEFVENGRAKRPEVRFDRLEITIPIRRNAESEPDQPDADGESTPASGGTHPEV